MENIIRIKKRTIPYYIFIMLVYIFLLRDPLEQCLPSFGVFDEILALMAIPASLLVNRGKISLHRKGICIGYWPFIFLVILSGILGNLIYRYQPFFDAAMPDMFLFLKFWLWIEVGICLFKSFDMRQYSRKIFKHITFIAFLFLFLIIFDNLLHIFPAEVRYGLRSTQLFYFHPTSFASCMMFLMGILLLLRRSISSKEFYYCEILLSILACSSFRSKIFGSVLLMWLIIYFIFIRKRKITMKTMLLFIPPVVFTAWEQIQFYFFSDMAERGARLLLSINSIQIANSHFPIGAGFATFASYYSGVFYSPLYTMLGISNVQGISPTDTSFISDTFWPMVIGQTGYVGLLCFVFAIYRVYKKIQITRKTSLEVYACGLFSVLYLLIESTTAAAFVHPIYVSIAFLLAYVVAWSDNHYVREKV